MYWYVREISTAVIVANLPHGWALLRRAFRLKSFLQGEDGSRSVIVAGGVGRTKVWPGQLEGARHGRRLSDFRGFVRGRQERLPSDAESVEVLGSRTRELPLEIWECKELRCSVEERRGVGEAEGSGSGSVGSRRASQERGHEGGGVVVIGKGETRTVCEAVEKDRDRDLEKGKERVAED